MEERKLTGYWVKQDNFIMNFNESQLSNITNSTLLFDEANKIETQFLLKDK
ncbi:hypothetical protein [Aquirufa ecclesiirivi]